MAPRLLAVALVLACALPAPAAAAGNARALLCKQSCDAAIGRCVEDGGRPRKCKRSVLRRCKREGITVCVPAQTYAVAPTGTDGAGCGGTDAPCRTIQFVIDELVPPEGAGTIEIAAGTFDDLHVCPAYPTPHDAVVCIVNKQITLRGGFVPPDWDTPMADPAATIIDGKGQGRGVHVLRGGANGPSASIEIDGLTIANGLAQAPSTGALDLISAFGGGLYAEHSPVTLHDVVFRNNEARGSTTSQSVGGRGSGGALAMYSGWPSVAAPASLQNVTFEGNRARGGAGADLGGYALGGALFTHSIAVTGDGLVFIGNSATGGTTAGAGTDGTDKADALGGAVAVETDGTVDLRHVTASGNVATGGSAPAGVGGGAFGGAFFAEQASLAVSDARIEGNRAEGGAGTNATGGGSIAQGGGVQTVMSSLTLDRVAVVGNEARAGDGIVNGGAADGGGVAMILGEFAGTARPFTIRNALIASNRLTVGTGTLAIGGGAGVFVNGASGVVEHATVADNDLGNPNFVGGGMALLPVPGWTTQVTVRNGIFANHLTDGVHPRAAATAALWGGAGTSLDVAHVLFANNRHDTNAGTNDPFNVPPGTFTLADIMSAVDAGFVSPGAPDDDYHLAAGSPAVDRAVGSTVSVDIDGNARPEGGAADLGAFERTP